MIKKLVKLAEHLDKKGFHKEADYVDWLIKQSTGYDKGYDPGFSDRNQMRIDYIVSKDIGIPMESYKKLFPMGMAGRSDSKETIELSRQAAPFSYFKDLILKVLKMKSEDENNLDESWCIYGVISTKKDKEEITYDLELNTFSCNELWIYLPRSNTPYAKKVVKKSIKNLKAL